MFGVVMVVAVVVVVGALEEVVVVGALEEVVEVEVVVVVVTVGVMGVTGVEVEAAGAEGVIGAKVGGRDGVLWVG
jgi:hypothetical protein